MHGIAGKSKTLKFKTPTPRGVPGRAHTPCSSGAIVRRFPGSLGPSGGVTRPSVPGTEADSKRSPGEGSVVRCAQGTSVDPQRGSGAGFEAVTGFSFPPLPTNACHPHTSLCGLAPSAHCQLAQAEKDAHGSPATHSAFLPVCSPLGSCYRCSGLRTRGGQRFTVVTT